MSVRALNVRQDMFVHHSHAWGWGGFAYSGRLSRSSFVTQGPYARQGCGLHMRVGSGVQPAVGVGQVLDDNGVLRCWQQRAHALQLRLPTICSLRRIEVVAAHARARTDGVRRSSMVSSEFFSRCLFILNQIKLTMANLEGSGSVPFLSGEPSQGLRSVKKLPALHLPITVGVLLFGVGVGVLIGYAAFHSSGGSGGGGTPSPGTPAPQASPGTPAPQASPATAAPSMPIPRTADPFARQMMFQPSRQLRGSAATPAGADAYDHSFLANGPVCGVEPARAAGASWAELSRADPSLPSVRNRRLQPSATPLQPRTARCIRSSTQPPTTPLLQRVPSVPTPRRCPPVRDATRRNTLQHRDSISGRRAAFCRTARTGTAYRCKHACRTNAGVYLYNMSVRAYKCACP
jgi:hypothetical protein